MEKTFNPQDIEYRLYKNWEQKGYFAPTSQGKPYSIMIPPPNITGSLHMGHAFQDAIMDALIRYYRMKGFSTLWQVGTDHAGIATQMVVERKISVEEGKSRHDYGRKAFIDKIMQWKEQSGGTITKQLRRMGASVDWDTERFTMDPDFCAAVQEVFVRLYSDGLIYRGHRLVNWDPKLHTAISDLEVENREVKGNMWFLRYPLADGAKTKNNKNYIVVATTRPETMLGDTGVAVNPADDRYKDLIGKDVLLPLVDRRIPIVVDEHADMEKGTGCVKITPAHDFNDNEVGKRCNLPMINVMTMNGDIRHEAECYNVDGSVNQTMTSLIPEAYQGMERFAARKQIITDLKEQGLLDKVEEHTLMVPHGDRSGVVIEPMLTDQWFVRASLLAKPAMEAVKDGRIQFVPKQYENMYFSWMHDIHDWCISRQLWWGHRIPAWYDEHRNVYVGRSEQEVREKYNIDSECILKQDEDVLDTWFSSSLWTFVTLGWPKQTERLKKFHPGHVLVTGFDIIFFWVARMIMMTLYLIKDENGQAQIPFRHVYVTGLIRDEQGNKMSKSKGNVLDPLDMIDGIDLESLVRKRCGHMMQPEMAERIEKRTRKSFPQGIAGHGTDALRYTLYSLASTGRDINWDMKRLEGYRNFCNKIWNAAHYVRMHAESHDHGNQVEHTLADRWIISQLQRVAARLEKNMSEYRFDHAARNLYDFVWNEYCAWYLELSKPVLWDENASVELKRGTTSTLVKVMESIMRLAHPFMPYITEEIWQNVKLSAGIEGDTLMLQSYPDSNPEMIDEVAERDIEWVKLFVTAIRNIRAELSIGPGKSLDVMLRNASHEDVVRLDENKTFLQALAKLSDIRILTADEEPPMAMTQMVGSMEVLVSLSGLIDKEKEEARLNNEIERLSKEVRRFESKLNNKQFISRAPADVIEKEKNRLAEAQTSISLLEKQLKEIRVL